MCLADFTETEKAKIDALWDEYVAASLKEADLMVAEGTMKYYTADEIRSKLDAVLNETV